MLSAQARARRRGGCKTSPSSVLSVDEAEWRRSYPVRFSEREKGVDNTVLANVYCFVERTLRARVDGILPPHAEHLRGGLEAAIKALDDSERVGVEQIQEVARQYLRLLDTLPLYDGLAVGDPRWLELVRAKRLVGLTLRTDQIHGIRTAMFFAQSRRENGTASPLR